MRERGIDHTTIPRQLYQVNAVQIPVVLTALHRRPVLKVMNMLSFVVSHIFTFRIVSYDTPIIAAGGACKK